MPPSLPIEPHHITTVAMRLYESHGDEFARGLRKALGRLLFVAGDDTPEVVALIESHKRQGLRRDDDADVWTLLESENADEDAEDDDAEGLDRELMEAGFTGSKEVIVRGKSQTWHWRNGVRVSGKQQDGDTGTGDGKGGQQSRQDDAGGDPTTNPADGSQNTGKPANRTQKSPGAKEKPAKPEKPSVESLKAKLSAVIAGGDVDAAKAMAEEFLKLNRKQLAALKDKLGTKIKGTNKAIAEKMAEAAAEKARQAGGIPAWDTGAGDTAGDEPSQAQPSQARQRPRPPINFDDVDLSGDDDDDAGSGGSSVRRGKVKPDETDEKERRIQQYQQRLADRKKQKKSLFGDDDEGGPAAPPKTNTEPVAADDEQTNDTPKANAAKGERPPLPDDDTSRQQWMAELGGMGRLRLMQEAEGWWKGLHQEGKLAALSKLGIKKPQSKAEQALGWPPDGLPHGVNGNRVLFHYAELFEDGKIPLVGGVPYQADLLGDHARQDRREKAKKAGRIQFGDQVVTPDGKVGTYKTSGGLSTNRAKIEYSDGTQSWENFDELVRQDGKVGEPAAPSPSPVKKERKPRAKPPEPEPQPPPSSANTADAGADAEHPALASLRAKVSSAADAEDAIDEWLRSDAVNDLSFDDGESLWKSIADATGTDADVLSSGSFSDRFDALRQYLSGDRDGASAKKADPYEAHAARERQPEPGRPLGEPVGKPMPDDDFEELLHTSMSAPGDTRRPGLIDKSVAAKMYGDMLTVRSGEKPGLANSMNVIGPGVGTTRSFFPDDASHAAAVATAVKSLDAYTPEEVKAAAKSGHLEGYDERENSYTQDVARDYPHYADFLRKKLGAKLAGSADAETAKPSKLGEPGSQSHYDAYLKQKGLEPKTPQQHERAAAKYKADQGVDAPGVKPTPAPATSTARPEETPGTPEHFRKQLKTVNHVNSDHQPEAYRRGYEKRHGVKLPDDWRDATTDGRDKRVIPAAAAAATEKPKTGQPATASKPTKPAQPANAGSSTAVPAGESPTTKETRPAAKPDSAKPTEKKSAPPPQTDHTSPAGRSAAAKALPPGKRGGKNSPLRAAMADARDYLTQLTEYEDGIIFAPAMYRRLKQQIPDLTPEEFKAEIQSSWDDGDAEPHILNEVRDAPRKMEELGLGGMNIHELIPPLTRDGMKAYIFMGGKYKKPLDAAAQKAKFAELWDNASGGK